MTLIKNFEETGNWLFRYRSYIPLLLFPFATLSFIFHKTDYFFDVFSWNLFCLLISLSGQVIRALVIGFTPFGTSGRNTEKQVAEQLNTSGMYAMVRHPLYLGNFLMWLGPVVYLQNLSFLISFCFFFWLYYERIMFAEEGFLQKKFGQTFIEWANITPAFFPKKFIWKNTDLHFSFKNILKREYSGLLALAITFAYLSFAKYYFSANILNLGSFWKYFLFTALLLAGILKFLKKKTKLLDIEGR